MMTKHQLKKWRQRRATRRAYAKQRNMARRNAPRNRGPVTLFSAPRSAQRPANWIEHWAHLAARMVTRKSAFMTVTGCLLVLAGCTPY